APRPTLSPYTTLFRSHLPAPHADSPDRVLVLHHPGAEVEEVDVLLDVEVAGEPGEVVPVPHLVGHLGPVGLPGLVPSATAVVVRSEEHTSELQSRENL